MPLRLDIPQSETIQLTEEKSVVDIEIRKIILRPEDERIDMQYVKGYDNSGTTVWGDKLFTVTFANKPAEGEAPATTDYTDLISRNPQLYTDMKSSSYSELQTKLGITGTVS